MIFTTFDFLYAVIIQSPIAFMAMILTMDYKIRLKSSLYFIGIILSYVLIFNVLPTVFSIELFQITLLNLIPTTVLFLYFNRAKMYSLKKSMILTLLATLMSGITQLPLVFAVNAMLPDYAAFVFADPLIIDSLAIFIRILPYGFLLLGISIGITFLFTKATYKIRQRIDESERAITVLAIISLVVYLIFHFAFTIMRYLDELLVFLTSWYTISLLIIFAIVFVSFLFYFRFLQEKTKLQHKEKEHELLQYYTEQVEEQQVMVRKFKHDFQNIISAMKGLMETENWTELKSYFASIEESSELTTKQDISLEGLRNVKDSAIKSIISSKLQKAMSLGINTTVDCREEIGKLAADSVTLVRMLGIILDNAIEASQELTAAKTKLGVTIFKTDSAVSLIISNICTPPPSHFAAAGYGGL